MSTPGFSLPATLKDLEAAARRVEGTMVHLAKLQQILSMIHQRLDMLPRSMSDTMHVPDPSALQIPKKPKFGRVVRRMREAFGWTREHLARLSDLSTSTVRNLETRSELFLSERVRHRIVAALAGHSRIRPRRRKFRS